MLLKKLKSFIYTVLGYFLFIFFLSIAEEDKIYIKFDKIFPSSVLESFHKLISQKKLMLQDISIINNKDEYIEKSIDAILEFHFCINLLTQDITIKTSYFKEDLENLIYFLNLVNNIIENNLIDCANSKKEVLKILFEKAIYKLSTI